MTYIFLYLLVITFIWWVYQVGWPEALKRIISILIPSVLIILFNIKAGRLLFRSPFLGILSVLPTTIFIYRGTQPFVDGINSWIDRKTNEYVDDSIDVVEAKVISKEDA